MIMVPALRKLVGALVIAEPPEVARLSLQRDTPHKKPGTTKTCTRKKKTNAAVFVMKFLMSSDMGIVVLQKSPLF